MKTTIRHEQVHCEGCPLFRDKAKCTTYIPTEVYFSKVDEAGEPDIDVLFVGDAPGRFEDESGTPFAGEPAHDIKEALQAVGITDNYAFANVIRCRPIGAEDRNRTPTVEELAACSNYLQKDLIQLKPKIVVVMGNTAKNVIAPQEWKTQSLNSLKGEVLEHEGINYIATISPMSYIPKKKYVEKQRFYRHIGNVKRILSGEQSAYAKRGKVQLLDTLEKVDRLFDTIEKFETPFISLDTETENLNRIAPNRLVTVQFSFDPTIGFVVPLEHVQAPWTPDELEHIRKRMAAIFSNPNLPFKYWTAHGAKFDYNKIIRFCRIVRFAKPCIDPIMLEYLRDENQRRGAGDGDDGGSDGAGSEAFDLKSMAKEKLGFYYYDQHILEVRSSGKLGDEPLYNEDGTISAFTEYAGMDAYVGWRITDFILKHLESTGHDKSAAFAEKWGAKITHLLTKVEANGIYVDQNQLAFLASDTSPILDRMKEIPEDIRDTPEGKLANRLLLAKDGKTRGMKPLFGKSLAVFDIDKKEHKSTLLIDAAELKVLSIGKDGRPSLNKTFWETYREQSELAAMVEEYEALKKMKTGYLESLYSFTHDPFVKSRVGGKKFDNADNLIDGRVHATFWADRVVTGRFNVTAPAVQTQPRGETLVRRMIKSMYGAAPGNGQLESDFGQAEIRWWAQIAQDEVFAKLFWDMIAIHQEYLQNPTPENKKRVENECDIHKQVYALMFSIPIHTVTKLQRQGAKGLSFGALYGMAAKTLAVKINSTEKEAQKLINTFILRFEKSGRWLTEIEEFAMEHGYVESPYGRRRHLQALIEQNPEQAKRYARNSPIQGAASDTTALAAYRLQRWIEDEQKDYKIVNIVHDAIYTECVLDANVIYELAKQKTEFMTNMNPFLKEEFGFELIVPMVVDSKIGLRTGHMVELDLNSTDFDKLVKDLKRQNDEIHNGNPFWKLAMRQELKIAEKDLAKAEESKDAKKVKKATAAVQNIKNLLESYAP